MLRDALRSKGVTLTDTLRHSNRLANAWHLLSEFRRLLSDFRWKVVAFRWKGPVPQMAFEMRFCRDDPELDHVPGAPWAGLDRW